MKKIIALVLSLALMCVSVFSLSSCGPKGKTLAQVQEAGQLVVATSPDFPPFENLVGGEIVGIEVEIMQLICEELGVTLVFEDMDFDSVLPGIQAAKYDCGMSGITVTPEREKNVLFTDVYYIAAQAIVVPADSDITCKADLEGKKVSVQSGTTAEDFCTDEGYEVKSFTANADAKSDMLNGNVDAWVVDNLTAKGMCEGDDSVKILDEFMTEEPYAFAFTFGSEDLVEAINDILADLIANGTVADIFEDYGEAYEVPEN